MTVKLGSDANLQMEAAWEFLEEGEVREDLVLAMEILWRGLYQIKDALDVIPEYLPWDEAPADPESGSIWPESMPLMY